jgi:hypothetical protein
LNKKAWLESFLDACDQSAQVAAGAPAMEAGEAGAVPTVTFTNAAASWAFPAHAMTEAELSAEGLLVVFGPAAVLVAGPALTLRAAFHALRTGRLRQVREREGVKFHITRPPPAGSG